VWEGLQLHGRLRQRSKVHLGWYNTSHSIPDKLGENDTNFHESSLKAPGRWANEDLEFPSCAAFISLAQLALKKQLLITHVVSYWPTILLT
jgi:hypothetical protein